MGIAPPTREVYGVGAEAADAGISPIARINNEISARRDRILITTDQERDGHDHAETSMTLPSNAWLSVQQSQGVQNTIVNNLNLEGSFHMPGGEVLGALDEG